jgi:hypothetical protein
MENIFDDLADFQYPPGMFAGQGRKRHKLEPESYEGDYDLILHPVDFEQLWKAHPEGRFTGSFGDSGVRVGNYEFYASVCGLAYDLLISDAIEAGDHLLISLPLMAVLALLAWIYEPFNQKKIREVRLLLGALDFSSSMKEAE